MSKDSPLLSIIIVTWNTAQITKNCIDSINTHLAGKLSYEIIVADNGSEDNTKELISRLDHVIYFNTGANLGFSKANNLAAQKSNSDLLFFLNSDMELVDSSLLDMIDYYQKNSNIGLIGPQFLNPDLTPQASVFPPQTPINAFKQFFLNQSAYSKYLPHLRNLYLSGQFQVSHARQPQIVLPSRPME
jgi:GT2 family glycosyltransferase